MASAHFGAATRNFVISENALGQGVLAAEKIAVVPPVVSGGHLEMPNAPGLGLELDPQELRAHIAANEPWWG
jgi:L-alanine-DL-glutamate epimerase-like enolase superfamily enzyme